MNARELALIALNKITVDRAYSNITVNDLLNKHHLTSEDASFFTKLVYGTLQNLLYLNYQIEPFLKGRKQKPWVQNLLRLAVYQMLFLEVPDYAAINEAVLQAKKKAAALGGFVNAVLRGIQRNGRRSPEGLTPVKRLSVEHSYPEWLVQRYIQEYGLEVAERILASEKDEKPLYIRINRLKGGEEETLKKLSEAGVAYAETHLPFAYRTEGTVQKTRAFLEGLITIQDLSAQHAVWMLAPKKGERVIDLCAAPGGKTAQIADMMENEGEIIACDVHPHKLELMENGFRRLGVSAKTKLLDAREVPKHFPKGYFDRVLADAPCSGLGVVSRRPEIKYELSRKKIKELVQLQKEILEAAWELVKPGGVLVYSTCTLNGEENEGQIEGFLARHNDAQAEEEKKILPQEFASDGFYICKLRRSI